MTKEQEVVFKNWLPFEKAREFAQLLGLKKRQQWFNFCKAGKLPNDIPSYPDYVYKKDWKGWGDWLGTGRISPVDRTFRPFDEARSFIQNLKLKGKDQWSSYCKSGNKPIDIPANPPRTYSKEWKGWGDWLGTGNISTLQRKYLQFSKAREFARTIGLKSSMQWREFFQTGRIPKDIPSHPDRIYRKQWKGWSDWLGASDFANKDKNFIKEIENRNRKWKKFESAKAFVHSLGLKTKFQWKLYSLSGKKPINIPQYPSFVYADWEGWSDWLGVSNFKINYSSFLDARKYARSLKLDSKKEWLEFCNSGKKSLKVPVAPESVYKKDWKGWGDWLGTGAIANMKRSFLPFKKSREFAQSLKLRSSSEWEENWLKNGLPKDIPTHPERTYAKEWKGWGNWLGTVTLREIKFRPFLEARSFVQLFKFPNRNEFAKFCRTKERPKDIPANPSSVYPKEWKGWGDWLGTGIIATWKREYLPFEKAREFARSLNLQRPEDWYDYIKSGKKPDNIPAAPWNTYKKDWMGIFDWLGYEGKHWSPGKVKELLKALIDSRIIYHWDEAVLYSFLLRKGLLNLHNNRHATFFKHLVQLTRSEDGRKLIEGYANSNEENPPKTAEFHDRGPGIEDEIGTVSSQELSTSIDNNDPLDYGKAITPESILRQTEVLESFNVDEEAIQFYIDYSIDELWKCAFENEQDTVRKVKYEGKTGNKYHDTVVETFLSDYEGSRSIKLPNTYSFPAMPTLMQLFVAYKIKTLPYFGNFSATGAGKTLSAILASRVTSSKLTIIVCPNDVVEQWKRSILETFHDSKVITGKDAFFIQYNKNEYQYAVLNYDKFSQEDSPNQILNLAKQKTDFIILDEVHFTKIRDEEEISKRRKNLDGLLTAIRRNNSDVKVLGLSATPVVNNLREGRSLLELLTGKIYDDVAIRPTIPNAVTLYEKLSTTMTAFPLSPFYSIW